MDKPVIETLRIEQTGNKNTGKKVKQPPKYPAKAIQNKPINMLCYFHL
jgi:hypothetical protein